MTSRVHLRVGTRSDPGLERPHNEDTFFSDPALGIFAVIDGVGGQNAGEKAAELAAQELKARLSRPEGTVEQALREAIAFANNKIYQHAQLHPQLTGMACVLSAVVIDDRQLYVGHVGDSRVYKVRAGQIDKLTHDHSPVGEREDRGEITELEAMRHPRRNEVYRDVGSELHDPYDDDFIEIVSTTFEPESALILCSDGLSDLVTSQRIRDCVLAGAGTPQITAEKLIQLALQEGGKDNVTVLVVEGPRFGGKETGGEVSLPRRGTRQGAEGNDRDEPTTRRLGVIPGEGKATRSRTSAQFVEVDGPESSPSSGSVRTTPSHTHLNPREDQPTARLPSARGEDVQRSFTVINNPERKTGPLRSLEGRSAGSDSPSGWVKGGRRGDGPSERAMGGRAANTQDDAGADAESSSEGTEPGGRIIQLPSAPGGMGRGAGRQDWSESSSGRGRDGDARGGKGTGGKGAGGKRSGDAGKSGIETPWLARLPGWAPALMLMVLGLLAFGGYLFYSGRIGTPQSISGGSSSTESGASDVKELPKVLLVRQGQLMKDVFEQALDGSVVVLAPGSYVENISLPDRITLVGAEPGKVFLAPSNPDLPVIKVEGLKNAAVIGITIRGGGAGKTPESGKEPAGGTGAGSRSNGGGAGDAPNKSPAASSDDAPVQVGIQVIDSALTLRDVVIEGCTRVCLQATGKNTLVSQENVVLHPASATAFGSTTDDGAVIKPSK